MAAARDDRVDSVAFRGGDLALASGSHGPRRRAGWAVDVCRLEVVTHTSKPDPSAPAYTIARRRWFLAPTSVELSSSTTSLASKSFHGRGFDWFLLNVFSRPGMRDVLHTCRARWGTGWMRANTSAVNMGRRASGSHADIICCSAPAPS